MRASTGGPNPRSSASGQPGPAGRHLLRSAVAARFSAVREMHAADVVTAIVLVTVTAAVVLAPQLHLGYPRQAEDLTMDTAASVVGLLAYFLVFGRLRRRTRLNELLLACALAVLALSNLFLCTVPDVAGWAPDDLTVWRAPVAGSFGALLFVLAAFPPDRQLRPSRPLLVVGAGAVTTALLLTMVLVPALARSLPPQVVASLAPGSSARPDLRLAQFCLQLAGAVLYGLAAVGFLRCSRRSRDEFLGWLAVAAMLAAAVAGQLSAVGHEPAVAVRRRRVPMSLLRCPAHWFHAGDLVLLACAAKGSGAGGAAADRLRAA